MRDQNHNILAMTIIYSMWCGWFCRAITKTNRGKYTEELADRFKKLIVDAYEIGQITLKINLGSKVSAQSASLFFSKYSLVHWIRFRIREPFGNPTRLKLRCSRRSK
jgi:hypothetical protein